MPYVRVNGVRLHYLAQGIQPAGPSPRHSLEACGEDWLLLQAPALSQRHRVLMPDLRGHGRSDVPPGPYTVPQMADDIAGFLEATGTDSAHMVGLSLGGAVAQALAVRHPTRVRSLVLVNTFAHLRPKGWAEWRQTLTRVLAPLLDHAKYARLEAEELFPHPGQRGLQRVAFQRLCSTHPMGFRAALPGGCPLRRAVGPVPHPGPHPRRGGTGRYGGSPSGQGGTGGPHSWRAPGPHPPLRPRDANGPAGSLQPDPAPVSGKRILSARMIRLIAAKILQVLFVLWLATTLAFFAFHLTPGDPAQTLLAASGAGPEEIARRRAELGLDDPILVQYVRYLADLARGNLGTLLATEPVGARRIVLEQRRLPRPNWPSPQF